MTKPLREELDQVLMKWNNASGSAEIDKILSLIKKRLLKNMPEKKELPMIKDLSGNLLNPVISGEAFGYNQALKEVKDIIKSTLK